jgi:hypothetical protein
MLQALAPYIAVLALTQLAALLSWVDRAGPCKVEGDQLHLEGTIKLEMLDCVKAAVSPAIKEVVIDVPGGLVDPAMQIADLLAPLYPALTVTGQCSSSCANYFLPIATSIRLEPGAYIMIHGSIDEGTVRHHVGDAPLKPQTLRELAMQKEFITKYGVHPGWLLVRKPEDFTNHQLGAHVATEDGRSPTDYPHDPNWKYLLVEEPFLRSCLPNIAVEPFHDTRTNRLAADPEARKATEKGGTYLTGPIRCKSEPTK